MTNSKTTKGALFSSVVALLLCFTMLLGTTFAWFTDSAATGVNTIQAGNLDIVVSYALQSDVVNGAIPDSAWKELDETTPVFNPDALWEPGYTEVVYFKIENNGSLALKYLMSTKLAETPGINKAGEEFMLSKYLTAFQMTGDTATIYNERAGAQTLDGFASMFPELAPANLADAANAEVSSAKALSYERELKSGEIAYTTMGIFMPTDVDNEANHNGVKVPSIQLGINVLATQLTYEEDSYDDQYDKDAEYSGSLRKNGNVLSITGDVTLVDEPLMQDFSATEAYTINGNGATVTGEVSSADEFQWTNGTIPAMSTIFSSADGAKVTVNDVTFTGTMSAVMAGNYVNSDSNWFNTEFNNVNIIDAEVVSFSANVSPALCVYGNLTMNNCTMTGTKLSALDTDPMWPAYDVVAVNYSNTVLNGCKIGSFYMWNQAKVTVGSGTEIETIIIRGNMNTTKYGLTVAAGAEVGSIDLTAIANSNKLNITIEDGATVGAFVDNGVTYDSIEAWKSAQ